MALRRTRFVERAETLHPVQRREAGKESRLGIRWAVAGTGRAHRLMVPAIQGASDSRVVAVCSRDKDRAAGFAAEHGIERACHAIDDVLRDPEIDAVYGRRRSPKRSSSRHARAKP